MRMFISLEYYYCVYIYIVNCVFIKLHCKIYYKRLKENDFVEERMKFCHTKYGSLISELYESITLVFSRHWYFSVYRRINARKNEK